MFVIWEEKVLNDSSILCSSPISAKILSKILIVLPSETGISKPDCAIAHNKPTVFKVTVFPPVLGPVITSTLKVLPKLIFIGTTLSFGINGCLAFLNSINSSIEGMLQSKSTANFTFEEIKSSLPIKLISFSK